MKKQLFLILASVLLCAIVYGQLSQPIHDYRSSLNHTDAKAVLYEQLAQPSQEGAIPSQRYPDYPTLDCQATDDFFVPEGLPWEIESLFFSGSYSDEPPGGPVEIVNVFFYEDDNNSPGPELHAFFMVTVSPTPEGDLDVQLPSLVSLPQGHYWISIQPVMEYEEAGRWFWDKQIQPTYGEQFYWQNPGGGFGYPETGSWTPGSEIEWSGTNNDLNLGFGIYGDGGGFPSVITHLSDDTPYAGQNIRIYGKGFGEFVNGCFIDINGVEYKDEITYWSNNEIFLNFPFLEGETTAFLSAVTGFTGYSNSIEVSIYEPAGVYFLNLKENQILSDDDVFISVAAEIDQDLISQAIFQYQSEGSSNWITIGIDNDGTAQHYSTFYPIGSGDGWGKWWNFNALADGQTVRIKAIMTTIYGQQLTSEISVIIDRTPLAPEFMQDGSTLDGGLAYMNDSLVFEVEAKNEDIQTIELNWQPVFAPLQGWWEIERELDPINQMEVAFLDNEGDTVSHMACGPSAMASCLKWLSTQYPDSDIGKMTTDSLAKLLAQDAGTDSTGTTSSNLNQAVRNAVANDNGISDEFEVETTYNRNGNNSHNVSNDIAAGLRDSSDVVLLIYQKTESGDTLGHYVTASSFHSEYHYEWHGEIEAAIQTSYVDFMDPATGERTDKQIGFSSNPPTIEDYDLNPETSSGSAWVHSVTTIKPNNTKRNNNTLITSYPANGARNYNLKLACADLPEGNNMIGIFGVNSQGDRAMNSYLRCVNGQYQLLPYFTSDRDTCITEYPINFIDLSMRPDTIVSWSWDFGDGHGVSMDQNPSYEYNETGEFDVRLVVSDGTIFDTITMSTYIKIVDAIEQNLDLPAGWSGISSFVDPAWPNLDSLLVDVYDDLIIMQNFSGILWPSEGVNTLHEWNTQEGYKIKFEAPVTINLRGLDAADRTVDLAAGWNYLPVLSQCHTLSQEIHNQLGSKLTVIKEIAGPQVFWPEYGISSLGQLAPGTAYMMLLTEAATISFPDCTKSTFENKTNVEVPLNPWGKVALSPNTHLVCVLAEAFDKFKQGDIIGAFDGKGNCIGFSEIKDPGQNLALVVFGDDPSHLTNQELIEGQNMQLKVFVAKRNETVSLFPAYELSMPDAGVFKTDGMSVIKSLDFTSDLTPDTFIHNLSIFPNPSNGIVYVQGIRGDLEVSVFNNMGERLVQKRVFGDGEIHFNDLPKGIYMLRISNGEHTYFEKLVLQ